MHYSVPCEPQAVYDSPVEMLVAPTAIRRLSHQCVI